MAPFMAPEMNVDIPTYKAMVMKAAANMGPTKTTITVWAYMARRRDWSMREKHKRAFDYGSVKLEYREFA